MSSIQLDSSDESLISDLVRFYEADRDILQLFLDQLRALIELPALRRLYHSHRSRLKDPNHLRNKLGRKFLAAKHSGARMDISTANLYRRVTDLVGLRLLHLHTTEFASINRVLLELLAEHKYTVLEGPEARVWDDEYGRYFESIGVHSVRSERMYTSVHYVVQANTRTHRTAEIQVRTLAEELWGEVDHMLNYPVASSILACREQIKVLARLTSSCTRLVDSIIATRDDSASPGDAAGVHTEVQR